MTPNFKSSSSINENHGCPWCQKPFDFLTFVMQCGSDTLIRHPETGHPREHLCSHCHKKFWMFYHPRRFSLLFRQYAAMGFVAGLAFGIAFLQLFMDWPLGEALLTGLILFFFSLPVAVCYARYQSVDLKQEK